MAAVLVSIPLEPRRVKTLETFQAPDPRQGGAPAEFALDVYKMVPKGSRRVGPGRFWGKDLHGIHAGDGADRLLPEALSALWKQGRVPREALPRLLAEIEPGLRASDFPTLLDVRAHKWLAGFFGLLALALAVLAARVAAGGAGHAPQRVPLAAWLARPPVEDAYVIADGPAPIDGTLDVDFEAQVPPAIVPFPNPGGQHTVAWFPAAGGHRLLLAARAQAPALPYLALSGVTLRPSVLGFPEGTLAELRKRVPDLDAGTITALFWSWSDGFEARGVAGKLWAAMAGLCAMGAVIIYLSIALRQARRRRQMAWLLRKL